MPFLRKPALWVCAALAAAGLVWDPSAPAADPKRVLLLAGAIVVLSVTLVRAEPVRVGHAAWAWLALTLWAGVGLLWGSGAALGEVAVWAAAGAWMACRGCVPEQDRIPAAQWTAALLGGGAASLAVLQYASGARGVLVHGGQGNGNWLGLLLAATIPLTAGALVEKRPVRWRGAAAAVSLVLQGAALLMSHSRVAWVATACAALGCAVLVRSSRRVTAAAVAGAVVLVATVAWSPRARQDAWRALEGRYWIWENSAALAARSQPWGAGTGRFAEGYLQVQGERLSALELGEASRTFENAVTAHQDWLQTAAEHGVVGLALLAAALGCGMAAAWRARWAPGFGAVAAVSVCAAGDSPLRQPAVVIVLAAVVAALPERPQEQVAAGRKWLWAAGLAAVSLLAAEASRCWFASRAASRAKAELPERATQLLEAAVRVAPRHGEAWFALGIARLEAGRAQEAIEALERSRPLLANVGTDIAIGNACMALSRPPCAVDAYRSALGLNPGSVRAHANLARAWIAAGDLEQAKEHLSRARRLWPGNPHLPAIEQELVEANARR
jgi:tetratricopeptide (TPR) repeat protein